MSSELERRTAIIVALVAAVRPRRSSTSSNSQSYCLQHCQDLKESEDIEEGFLTPERKTPDRSQGQNVKKEVYLDVMQTVVKPGMTQIAAGRPYLSQQDGATAHTSNLVQNWCLENLD
ncbi:Transposable element tcb2 transposase, partial [Caligus rogercresseyi]